MIGSRVQAADGARNRRPPAVAGSFYPAAPEALARLVRALLDEAAARGSPAAASTRPAGILVPHAGLVYSGVGAAAAWRLLALDEGPEPPGVVILGTNHVDPWLDGIGVWRDGAWATPLGDVAIDDDLAADIVSLGAPFHADRDAHAGEHSIEVQLPLLQAVAAGSRIVPLAVSAGRGAAAVDAGRALGGLLAARARAGRPMVLAISTDMAHYPSSAVARAVTEALLPALTAVDPEALASAEAAGVAAGVPGLACGMCGIEPAVVGLAALRALGATTGTPLLASTSADAGGPEDRVVGYLSMRFDR